MSVSIELTGRNALVTGAGSGIGKAVAALLAQAGANVFLSDIHPEKLQKAAQELREQTAVAVFCHPCNMAEKAEVDTLVKRAWEAMGSIDILSHNAGLSRRVEFMDIDEALYDLIMDVNARGTFFLNQAVLRVMIPQRSGKIVNMASMAGKEGFTTNLAYTASKFAVTGMTQALAKFAAPYNINVNAVCPGFVRTQIWEDMIRQTTEQGRDGEEYWKERTSVIPLGRPQTVLDIARMVLYLVSDFADNMTGQAINVTGGMMLH